MSCQIKHYSLKGLQETKGIWNTNISYKYWVTSFLFEFVKFIL